MVKKNIQKRKGIKHGGEVPLELRPEYTKFIRDSFTDPYKGINLSKLSKKTGVRGKSYMFPVIFLDRLIRTIKELKQTKKNLSNEDYKIIFSEIKSFFPEIKLKISNKFINTFLTELQRTLNVKQSEEEWYDNAIAYASGNLGDEIKQKVIINNQPFSIQTLPTVPLPITWTQEPKRIKQKEEPKQITWKEDTTQKDTIDTIIKQELKKLKEKDTIKRGEDKRSSKWFKNLGKESEKFLQEKVQADIAVEGLKHWMSDIASDKRVKDLEEEWLERSYQERKEHGILPESELRLSDYMIGWVSDKYKDYTDKENSIKSMYEEGIVPPKSMFTELKMVGKDIIKRIEDYRNPKPDIELQDYYPDIEFDYYDDDDSDKGIGVGDPSSEEVIPLYDPANFPEDSPIYNPEEYEDIPIYNPSYDYSKGRDIGGPMKLYVDKPERSTSQMVYDMGKELVGSIFKSKSQVEKEREAFEKYADVTINKLLNKDTKELKDTAFNEIFNDINPAIVHDEIQNQYPNKSEQFINNKVEEFMIEVSNDIHNEVNKHDEEIKNLLSKEAQEEYFQFMPEKRIPLPKKGKKKAKKLVDVKKKRQGVKPKNPPTYTPY